ncbi:MAG: Translation initiation factor IF-1 [Chlamydiia bacterium]|nr:Translation initiation factor IF-1 [Chlamydiia bacterium]
MKENVDLARKGWLNNGLFFIIHDQIDYSAGFMGKEELLKMDGKVVELLQGMNFRVQLENGHEIICHLCGKMRVRNIRVLVGDVVTIEMSPYDLTKGRVVYRKRA